MGTYVPTGGQFNDPDKWKTDPGYGQTGANRAAGYNPAYWADKGGEDAFKASRRAYRAQYQPGGKQYEKYMNTYAAIAARRPQNEAQLGQVLDSIGIHNEKENGQAMYRTVMNDFNNAQNGLFQYDPESGRKLNVGTSDVTATWQPMTQEDYDFINRGFYGRIDDMFGFRGKGTGMIQDAQGNWHNPGPGGGQVYDSGGWQIDPATGQRIGGGYMPYMGTPSRQVAPSPYASPAGRPPIGPGPTGPYQPYGGGRPTPYGYGMPMNPYSRPSMYQSAYRNPFGGPGNYGRTPVQGGPSGISQPPQNPSARPPGSLGSVMGLGQRY